MSANDTARITHQLGRAEGTRRTRFVVSVPPPTTGTPYARTIPPAPAGSGAESPQPAVSSGIEHTAIASGDGCQFRD
jgi:hypothetical protein